MLSAVAMALISFYSVVFILSVGGNILVLRTCYIIER